MDKNKLIGGCLDKIYPDHPSSSEFLSTCKGCINPEFKTLGMSQEIAAVDYINSKASNKTEASQLLVDCKKGMLNTLDERSRFMEAQAFTNLPKSAKEPIGVIGVEIVTDQVSDKGTVKSVLRKWPAEIAGVRPDDVIISIDGDNIQNLSGNQIINLLQGHVDSYVSLQIRRGTQETLLDYNIQRKLILTRVYETKLLRPDYAYIGIEHLDQNVSKDFSQKLLDLYTENKGNLKGLVLDLRNNPGGLLSESNGIVAPFLPKDSLVSEIKGRSPDANMKLTTNPRDFIRYKKDMDFTKTYLPAYQTLPIVILINSKTASGAEIIAVAMQHYKRATIMGQSSFGLSSIQTIFPMWSGEALKVTSANWYTPSGKSVEGKGITPDVITEITRYDDFGSENDVTLNLALEYLMKHQDAKQ